MQNARLLRPKNDRTPVTQAGCLNYRGYCSDSSCGPSAFRLPSCGGKLELAARCLLCRLRRSGCGPGCGAVSGRGALPRKIRPTRRHPARIPAPTAGKIPSLHTDGILPWPLPAASEPRRKCLAERTVPDLHSGRRIYFASSWPSPPFTKGLGKPQAPSFSPVVSTLASLDFLGPPRYNQSL